MACQCCCHVRLGHWPHDAYHCLPPAHVAHMCNEPTCVMRAVRISSDNISKTCPSSAPSFDGRARDVSIAFLFENTKIRGNLASALRGDTCCEHFLSSQLSESLRSSTGGGQVKPVLGHFCALCETMKWKCFVVMCKWRFFAIFSVLRKIRPARGSTKFRTGNFAPSLCHEVIYFMFIEWYLPV